MLATASPVAPLLRYSTGSCGSLIRIEWLDSCGLVRSTYGRFDGHEIRWAYADAPDALASLATLCAATAGEQSIVNVEWLGYETPAEMDRQVAARCCGCQVVQATEDELSGRGLCGVCWIASMARSAS